MSNIKQAGYQRVQKDLRKQIVNGFYSVGDILPSENELAKQYNLSRMTIRIGLRNLESEGLIYRKKGKGSFVGFKRNSIELLSVRGFTEIMKDKDLNISSLFVQKPELKPWKADFNWKLSSKELKSGCIHFSRIRRVKDKPVMFEDTFISNIGLRNFCDNQFVNGSLFDTLIVNHDLEISGVVQKFRAIGASESLAQYLNVNVGSPILEIMRKLETSELNVVIYSFAYCNTNDFTVET